VSTPLCLIPVDCIIFICLVTDAELWLEYEQLHLLQLLEHRSTSSDARNSSELGPSGGGNRSGRVSQEGRWIGREGS
jgi:hypothetical protein